MRRFVRLILFTIILCIIGVYSAFNHLEAVYNAPGPSKNAVTVVIPKGANLSRVVSILDQVGVLADPFWFEWSVRFEGAARKIQAGEYLIEARQSPKKILGSLISGKTVLRQVTIPEGLMGLEVAALLNAAPALKGTSPIPAEGSILPETYSYRYGESRVNVLNRMSKAMDKVLAELWKNRKTGLPFSNPYEAVILASIVEKETGVREERSRVAGVFLNRLRRGMRLQSDPTVAYAVTNGERPLNRPLTRTDLDATHPFNTYRIKGLPPGPISNPGRAALSATLNPLETLELYFVADGTGGHAFAKTLAEHNRNVAQWRNLRLDRKNY
tara:strand:- start:43110 stop:44093 length:984 start_codon:yes stop_codon:yes gene_type:complete